MSQCLGKMVYRDRAIATRVADNYTRTNYQKRTFRVYTCPICDEFHLSTVPLEVLKLD